MTRAQATRLANLWEEALRAESPRPERDGWIPGEDLNLDSQVQSLLSYH